VAVLFDPLGQLSRRICAELQARELHISLSAAQRFGPLAGLVQRGHEAERGVGAQRVELEEASPPVRRHPVVAPDGRFGTQHLQRSSELARQPRPLGLRPGLELSTTIEVEAVQKRCGVARDRPGRIVLLQRGRKGLHVARDHGWIEPQLDRPEEEIPRLEIAAEDVTGLVEECATVLGIGFGPQGCDEFVAAEAAMARGGKEGEQP
jgi:hypothetical protein